MTCGNILNWNEADPRPTAAPSRPCRRTPRLLLAAGLALVARSGFAAGFNVAEGASPPATTLAPQSLDWGQARFLPAALGLAATEVRRDAAGNSGSIEDLKPGPDGSIDLSLSTVIDLTLKSNLEVRIRSYDPALAEEQLRAREAIFDPLLRFTLSLFSSTSPTSGSLAGASVLSRRTQQANIELLKSTPWGGQGSIQFSNSRDTTNNAFSTLNPVFASNLTLSYRQPLLRDFGKDVTRREIRIANNDKKSSREAFRDQVMGKVGEAIDAYWDLGGKRESLAVQREGLKLANDLLKINRTRVEVGTMAPLDVSAAEADVARNEERVIAAEHDLRGAEDRVRQLMNIPVISPIWSAALRPTDPPTIEARAIDVEAAIQTAFGKRPELIRQSLAIENTRIRAAYASSQLKPGLELQASYGFDGIGGTTIVRSGFGEETVTNTLPGGYGDATSQLFHFDFPTWRLAAVLEIPISNQAARANHTGAVLALHRDEHVLESARQAIAVEVRRLARAIDTNRKRSETAGSGRGLQEKRLNAELKKLEHGLSTNFEVSQAQKDLTEAGTLEAVAMADYKRSVAAFERATGTLLESYAVHIQE